METADTLARPARAYRMSLPGALAMALFAVAVGAGGGIPAYRAFASVPPSLACDDAAFEQLRDHVRRLETRGDLTDDRLEKLGAKLDEIAGSLRDLRRELAGGPHPRR